jgi:hypothetical protein
MLVQTYFYGIYFQGSADYFYSRPTYFIGSA